MSDLVEILRATAEDNDTLTGGPLMEDAAAEIARLRAELTEARAALADAACTCSPAFQKARRPKAERG